MIDQKQIDIIDAFLATNPDSYDLMDAAGMLFRHRSDFVNAKDFRSCHFIIPDTVFFNYGEGVRSVLMHESYYENSGGYSVHVHYGTIDDSSMSFWVYLKNLEDTKITYDVIVQNFHLDPDWQDKPVGLTFVESAKNLNSTKELYDAFEKAVKEILEEKLRVFCEFYVQFDYN